jgi:hypothetical protein
MIAAVRIVVPWALLVTFLACAVRWRIFLLGIPFLMFMGTSVFFDTMRVFRTPGRFEGPVLILLWLIVVWMLATGKLLAKQASAGPHAIPRIRRRPFLPEELAVAALAALVLGHILVDAVHTADFAGAAGRGLGMLSMVAGYFLIRDIVEHATRHETIMFLAAVVLANTVATVLYILHQGLHVSIYTIVEHMTIVLDGQVITRTFWIAPPFVALTLAFVFARRRWTLAWSLVLLIAVIGIGVSYTRTLLMILVATLLLTLFARQLKRPAAGRLLKSALGIAVVGLALFWGFATFIPTQTHYFQERLAGLQANPTATRGGSLFYRSQYLASTVAIVERRDVVFGVGFPPRADAPSTAQVEAWGSDMAWILVLYRLGIAGVLVLVAMFVGFGARAFRLFISGTGDREYLGLVLLAAIIASALLTGSSWGFMQPGVLPMGLWLFAFVAAEARRIGDSAAAPVPAVGGDPS